jgi:hypothetical protein
MDGAAYGEVWELGTPPEALHSLSHFTVLGVAEVLSDISRNEF